MKPTVDLFETIELPNEVKSEFLEVWDEPEYFDGSDSFDGACGRCGASVHWARFDLHKRWHKNLTFGMFLLNNYVVEHNKMHAALGEAFPGIVELLEEALGERIEKP